MLIENGQSIRARARTGPSALRSAGAPDDRRHAVASVPSALARAPGLRPCAPRGRRTTGGMQSHAVGLRRRRVQKDEKGRKPPSFSKTVSVRKHGDVALALLWPPVRRCSTAGRDPFGPRPRRTRHLPAARQRHRPPMLQRGDRCALPTWWLLRGRCTRSHSEPGREMPQRRWYFVSRRGRVGRCQVCKTQHLVSKNDGRPDANSSRRGSAPATCSPPGHPNQKIRAFPDAQVTTRGGAAPASPQAPRRRGLANQKIRAFPDAQVTTRGGAAPASPQAPRRRGLANQKIRAFPDAQVTTRGGAAPASPQAPRRRGLANQKIRAFPDAQVTTRGGAAR